jgi:hypothetical protein
MMINRDLPDDQKNADATSTDRRPVFLSGLNSWDGNDRFLPFNIDSSLVNRAPHAESELV